ncbi:MAG: M28 family peptidase [Variibacter sp.]
MTTIDQLCSDVQAGAMMRHLEEFARRVKLSGTPEELESFKYLQKTLDGCGFKTELIQHDAYISLPGKAKLVAGDHEPACITHSFSRSSGPKGVSGEMIYLGSGAESDFAKQDVRGKIVLVDGLASPAVSKRATQAGAVGQVHAMVHEHKHEMCISPVWGSPTDETVKLLPTTVVVTVNKEDGDGLKARLAQGESRVKLFAEVDTSWRKTPILTAELASANGGADEPFVMFSGHHDTWYFGVMDNGAANATMLEIARLFASRRAEFRRGLRLCFWSGHSHGRYSGSTWYADKHWAELERRCVAHVNVDSTGGRGNTVLNDMPASSELRALAVEAVQAQGQQELSGERMSRAGDQSFWGIGIPSLFMGGGEQPAAGGVNVAAAIFGGAARKGAGFGWWWHTPDDTIDKIDLELLVRDTRVYVHALWRLLTDAVVPLDYADYADALIKELEPLKAASAKGVDVTPLLEAARDLKSKAAAFNARIAKASDKDAAALQAVLMKVSRHLVPIDYTSGDRFGQEPALALTPYPVLDPIRRLMGATAGSDAARFLAVAATRACNRARHAIDGARSVFAASPA